MKIKEILGIVSSFAKLMYEKRIFFPMFIIEGILKYTNKTPFHDQQQKGLVLSVDHKGKNIINKFV